MLDYLKKRPMLIAAVSCLLTAICGYYSFRALLFLLAADVFATVIFILKRKITHLIVGLLILFVIISGISDVRKIKEITSFANETVTAEVCISATTYKGTRNYKTDVEIIESEVLKKGTKLSLWHDPMYFNTGEIYSCVIELEDIDGEYKALNYSNGIYLSGEIKSCKLTDKRDYVLGGVQNIRDYIKDTVFRNMSYESAATVCALVFGDKSYFSDEFYGAVKASGVAHVMVVSGMHLSIIVSLLIKFTEKRIYNPLLRAITMFMTVILICAVCGFTMSILRAGVTYILMSAALLLKRQYSGENALAGAVVLILINSPFAILSVGFQLSVLSTFGILAVALPICKYIKKKLSSKVLVWFSENVVISLSAMLLTLPVIIKVYGYVSLVAVITNILITIPVNWCLCISVAALTLGLILPFTASVILNAADYLVRYINSVIMFFGKLPFSTVRTPEYLIYVSIGVIFSVFHVMLACKKREDMLKLKKINEKIKREGGKRWLLSQKKN